MSTTKKNKERMESCHNTFDYLVKMNLEKISKGGFVQAEFCAVVFMPNEESFTIIPIPLGDTVDAEQRREIMIAAGEDLAEMGADAFVFMTVAEAWASTQNKNSKFTLPSADPHRKEVFIASAEDKKGMVRNVSYEIKRKSKKIDFERINIFGKSQAKFMFDWVDPKKSKVKIENSLTEGAWKSYKKKCKEIKL